MEFNISRVYTTVNADSIPIGSKVLIADNLAYLKKNVECSFEGSGNILREIKGEEFEQRFVVGAGEYPIVYLVDLPEDIKLKWTDLKLGDIVKDGTRTSMVTVIDTSNKPDEDGDILHICLGDCWYTDFEIGECEKVE